ncbi:hypothetical protein P3X46_001506 [Hevea brasiliensis]|uniref:non-specific serine/threonine protein kinase n=1 Tax=Hevea brasiliensis TaxID=3981 RepID=A0ABQ9NF80_HEVBR|nr:hypothetical protein P3X46_001506 [Hevea brasiliensis]
MDKFFPLFAIFSGAFLLSFLGCAQDQSDFISIDSGITDGSSYVDEITSINYVSDAPYIYTGVSENISAEINTMNMDRQYLNLRSFPEGTKSCYTLNATQGKNNRYLIRAGFLYGNYDKKGDVPRFDLYLGVNWWETVVLNNASSFFVTEIIHVSASNHIDVCLVNTGFGTPFISVLELRPLKNDIYVNVSGSLENYGRCACGLTSDQAIRFPKDLYDRIWSPCTSPRLEILSTASTIQESSQDNFQIPSTVMQTAVTPLNDSHLLKLHWMHDDSNSLFYIYLDFAEIQELKTNQSRELNIYVNGELWYGPFSPKYLQTTTIYRPAALNNRSFEVVINKTENSTLLPLLNAFEIYLVKEFLQPETDQQDVEAILNINSTYRLKRYWQGDPCAPIISLWDGLNCSYEGHNSPRIISLDLSSSGLTGPISSSISKLTMLQFLDLSNNDLTGPVPDFLSQLQFLRVLNLANNKLSGSVPLGLTDRSKNGTLLLNVRKNPNLCSSDSWKNKIIIPVVAAIGSIFILLLIAAVVFWILKRRKQGEMNEHNGTSKLKEQNFSYSEILNITNNLERVLGNGKFGTIFHGYLDDTQVAVKIFFSSYVHGYKQFQVEAKILARVHHRNLTTCFGYCNEYTNKGLIYEYMANGNLEDILSDRNANFLSWQERLQIAMDVAQGLEFLHNGCNPPIIHGNLKPTNILLDESLHAKLVDFGLSKVLTTEGATSEYLDPDYYITTKLIERHDVYSFGLVLLAIITRDINNIVDSKLKGNFQVDSVWKTVELAMACVSSPPINRPTMTRVVKELNQCLAMEIARLNRSEGTIELVTVNLTSGLDPQAR